MQSLFGSINLDEPKYRPTPDQYLPLFERCTGVPSDGFGPSSGKTEGQPVQNQRAAAGTS